MYITRRDVEKILEVMDKFPDTTTVELIQDGHSGLGSIMTLTVPTLINGIKGEFKTEISGVENW
jgi:hypothetical protein